MKTMHLLSLLMPQTDSTFPLVFKNQTKSVVRPKFSDEELIYIDSLPKKEKKKAVRELLKKYATMKKDEA